MLAGVLLSGCAGWRIHSETRDQQGSALQSAWEKGAVTEEIVSARKNLSALQKEQAITSDRLTASRRKAEINAMSAGGTVQDKLFAKIDRALLALAGSPDTAAKIAAAVKKEADATAAVEHQKRGLQQLAIEVPDCRSIRDSVEVRTAMEGVGAVNAIASDYIKELIKACQSADLVGTIGIDLSANSLLATARISQEALRKRIDDLQRETLVLRLRYRTAVLTYDAAKGSAGSDADLQKRVTGALGDAREALEAIARKPDKYSKAFVAGERKASIDRFFTAVLDTKEGESLPDSASDAALFFRLFPRWLDETKADIAASRTLLLQPLLMQRDFEKAQADALDRDIASGEREIAVLDAIVALHLDQIAALVQARGALRFPGTKAALPLTFRNVFDIPAKGDKATAISVDARTSLIEAAGLYLDAQYRTGGEIDKLAYEQHYLKRERALIYAEANLNQWSMLIGGSIEQLAAYGQGGIKPETLFSFIDAVSLVWIAKGVN